MPDLLPDSDWNWQGKLLTLAATLAIGALPMFGWRRVGLTLAQAPGSLKAALPVLVLYCAFFVMIALAFPHGTARSDVVAFQQIRRSLGKERVVPDVGVRGGGVTIKKTPI